jgi:hypothetical protein
MKNWGMRILGVLGVLLLMTLPLACGGDDDDGGGGPVSASEACAHFCGCPEADDIPNCQSTCVSGIEMATDSDACARCTAESSCSALWNNSCASACSY